MPLKTFRLDGPQFLNPLWFNRVRGGERPAIVQEDGEVLLEGELLRVRDATLAPGTAVKVWLNTAGFFVCATDEELAREAEARRVAQAAEDERRRLLLNARRTDAEAFNARFALPVKWCVGIKDVLSGLTERSWGDGRNKATVEHIYLLEPLATGRLTRDTGDFLCTSGKGSNGKRYSQQPVRQAVDGDGNHYQPKVTCKACLALAKQWMRHTEEA